MTGNNLINHVSATVNLRKIVDCRIPSIGELTYFSKLSNGRYCFKTSGNVSHVLTIAEIKSYCLIV